MSVITLKVGFVMSYYFIFTKTNLHISASSKKVKTSEQMVKKKYSLTNRRFDKSP